MTVVDTTTGEITETHVPIPAIPFFEGKPVAASALKIATGSNLELEDVVLAMDDIIHILVEARVSSVNHVVHEPTAQLVRVHTAKALGARLVPFNPEFDNGVDPA